MASHSFFCANMASPVTILPSTGKAFSNSAAALISFVLSVSTGRCPNTPPMASQYAAKRWTAG
jgi:hypothetical protein